MTGPAARRLPGIRVPVELQGADEAGDDVPRTDRAVLKWQPSTSDCAEEYHFGRLDAGEARQH